MELVICAKSCNCLIFNGFCLRRRFLNLFYYQWVIWPSGIAVIGLKVEAEVKTNKGRIDAVIIDKDIYIFEFKFNGNKDKALRQIKERGYSEKYHEVGRKIYLFGVEFMDRNIGKWYPIQIPW